MSQPYRARLYLNANCSLVCGRCAEPEAPYSLVDAYTCEACGVSIQISPEALKGTDCHE